jgi:hypothetical protein
MLAGGAGEQVQRHRRGPDQRGLGVAYDVAEGVGDVGRPDVEHVVLGPERRGDRLLVAALVEALVLEGDGEGPQPVL